MSSWVVTQRYARLEASRIDPVTQTTLWGRIIIFWPGGGGHWAIFWGMQFLSHFEDVHDFFWWARACARIILTSKIGLDSRKHLLDFCPHGSPCKIFLSSFCCAGYFFFSNFPTLPLPPSKN